MHACTCMCVCVRVCVHYTCLCIPTQDMQTGFHKGYGWVRMSSEEEVQKVLDYKRHAIEGYEVSGHTL